jgi:hypothetical protein
MIAGNRHHSLVIVCLVFHIDTVSIDHHIIMIPQKIFSLGYQIAKFIFATW